MTQDAKHTPGPWTIETPMGDDDPWIVEAGKQSYEWHCIAIVPCGQEDEDDLPVVEARANARLIASAPTLSAALEREREKVRELREALRPFAKMASGPTFRGIVTGTLVKASDVVRARHALTNAGAE